MITPDAFHELEVDDPEMLDFTKPDFAIMSLYKLITVATEHMNEEYPNQQHLVFIRVPMTSV